MHQLIATYLFQNKQCPLPGLGHLYVEQINAETDFVNKKIQSPQFVLKFSATEIDDEHFLSYTSSINGNTNGEIKNKIQHLFSKNFFTIDGVGVFKKENGELHFEPTQGNENFYQPIHAERVVHENEAHTMVVGDTETTTTTAMTEYFAEDEIKKDYWWVWALVLAAISTTAICIYYFGGYN